MTKLIFLSGSIRKGSYNESLAKLCCEIASSYDGVEAEYIDLKNYELPIFNEDLEGDSFPKNAIALKKKFRDCDGFFIASPEYNSTFSPLLKNVIDWVSRKAEHNEPILHGYKGKVAAIASVSVGVLGGIRGLPPLRVLLSNIMVNVIANQVAIGNAPKVFDDNGRLIDERYIKMVNSMVDDFVAITKKLSS